MLSLGVPYVIGFQSNSSVIGECLVHLYEYGMCMLMIVFVFVVKFFLEGLIWFTRKQEKEVNEVWFTFGRFFVGVVNVRILDVLKKEMFWYKLDKKNIYQNKIWFKYRGKSKIYYYMLLEFFENFKPISWMFDNKVWTIIWIYFTDIYEGVANEKVKTKNVESCIDSDINRSLENKLEINSIAKVIWDIFYIEKEFRYELWYQHYSFTGVIWTFLDWNYMRMRKCFKICEFSNWVKVVKNREVLIKSLASRSLVPNQFSKDVYFSKEKKSVHILELESFCERNLNVYFYGVAAVYDIRMETWWTLSPGVLLFFWWYPTILVVYSQSEFLAPMFSFNVAGKQWSWIYEIANLNVDKQNKLPCHLTMFDSMGINNPAMAFVKLQKAWRVLVVLDTTALEFRSKLVPDRNLHPGLLRLLEVDHWIALKMNMELRVLVSGIDVIHSFGIQGLGCKMDAVPGRVHGITVFLKRPGMFYGQCSELCGIEHGFMPIAVEVVKVSQIKGSKLGLQWI